MRAITFLSAYFLFLPLVGKMIMDTAETPRNFEAPDLLKKIADWITVADSNLGWFINGV